MFKYFFTLYKTTYRYQCRGIVDARVHHGKYARKLFFPCGPRARAGRKIDEDAQARVPLL